MAKNKTSLSGAKLVKFGYGQVEGNHLSAPQNGQVYAQLPAAATIEKLENGQFVRYSYADGVCNFNGSGPWMMVNNEVKVYAIGETDADFAMLKGNYTAAYYSDEPALMPKDTTMVPRVMKISVGDIWTTNTVNAEVGDLTAGTDLKIDAATGYLVAGAGAGGDADPQFKVVKVYTMPDLQPGVKIQRVG